MEWRVSAALTAGGVKPGDVSLHVGRHYFIRDLITWCNRMQVITTVCQQLTGVRAFCVKRKALERHSLGASHTTCKVQIHLHQTTSHLSIATLAVPK